MVITLESRVAINEHFMFGIVSRIPIYEEDECFSMFTRLIYEPKRELFEKRTPKQKRTNLRRHF